MFQALTLRDAAPDLHVDREIIESVVAGEWRTPSFAALEIAIVKIITEKERGEEGEREKKKREIVPFRENLQ